MSAVALLERTPSLLLSAEVIRDRVAVLGGQLTERCRGTDVVVVGVLTGAAVFAVDLIRQMRCPVELDFVAVSSYGGATQTSGEVRLLKDLDRPVYGRHIVLVEDIVDTGLTLRFLLDAIGAREPAEIIVCALLDKPSKRRTEVRIDYTGFSIDDQFVVGYGLDYAGRYRNLEYVGVLER